MRFGITGNSADRDWMSGRLGEALSPFGHWRIAVVPVVGGLLIDPCIPPQWDGFRTRRKYRGATYDISMTTPSHVSKSVTAAAADGARIDGHAITALSDGRTHTVEAVMG